MKFDKFIFAGALVAMPTLGYGNLNGLVNAQPPTVQLNWRYEEAETGRLVRGTRSQVLTDLNESTTDHALFTTVLATRLGNAIQSAVQAVHATKQDILPADIHGPNIRGEDSRNESTSEQSARAQIAAKLLVDVADIKKEFAAKNQKPQLAFEQALDLTRKLAQNIKDFKGPGPIFHPALGGGIRALSTASVSAAASLNVGTGGAQDYGYFRKLVEDGYVPTPETFLMEGFLAEFDLSLPVTGCDELVCLRPGVLVDSKAKKMWVQLAMGSKVTPDAFKRLPLNLSIVLDISGSMSATDDTEKNRLEWAKEALTKAVNELSSEDYLSVVIFDTKSEVLVAAQRLDDKAAVLEKIQSLQPRGSTNLHAGLSDGYAQIARFQDQLPGFENRLILISDAWLNTGVTEDSALTKLVSDFAAQKVGLTAIGVGAQFNQKFIQTVSNSQGGNYVYVHSGRDMMRFFESFDFLVTPVAYGFRANITLGGLNAKLVKTYGVAAPETQAITQLINVPTLFFSNNGGAIVLEYDLKD